MIGEDANGHIIGRHHSTGIGRPRRVNDIALGFSMLLGQFLPIIFVLALAGSLARQQQVPKTEGTLPTHGPLFVGMLTGVVLIVAGLTFFPVLALGPLAEGL